MRKSKRHRLCKERRRQGSEELADHIIKEEFPVMVRDIVNGSFRSSDIESDIEYFKKRIGSVIKKDESEDVFLRDFAERGIPMLMKAYPVWKAWKLLRKFK